MNKDGIYNKTANRNTWIVFILLASLILEFIIEYNLLYGNIGLNSKYKDIDLILILLIEFISIIFIWLSIRRLKSGSSNYKFVLIAAIVFTIIVLLQILSLVIIVYSYKNSQVDNL